MSIQFKSVRTLTNRFIAITTRLGLINIKSVSRDAKWPRAQGIMSFEPLDNISPRTDFFTIGSKG